MSLIADTLVLHEPQYSKAAQSHDAWEPEWIVERFVAFLKCGSTNCGEFVAVSGKVEVSSDYGDYGESTYDQILCPQNMCPAPPIISIPAETPTKVKNALTMAFQLFWIDLNASANSLRTSVEALLTNQKIPRYTRSKGKRVPLTLNARIDKFAKADAELKDTLHALRIIGNVGSHDGGLTMGALLDAFEIYEDTLALVCGRRVPRLRAIRQKIKKTKGKYNPQTRISDDIPARL